MGAGLPTEAIALEDRPEISREQSPWAVTAVGDARVLRGAQHSAAPGASCLSLEIRPRAQPVAVISRSMARAYWPDADPVGRRLRLAGGDTTAPWLTVIGVVEDVRPFDPNSPQVRQMYLPFAQSSGRALVYFVATRDTPLGRLQDVRLAVRDVDPDFPVLNLQTMTEVHGHCAVGS